MNTPLRSWWVALVFGAPVGGGDWRLHTASRDLRVVKNYGDKIQAHYLALADRKGQGPSLSGCHQPPPQRPKPPANCTTRRSNFEMFAGRGHFASSGRPSRRRFKYHFRRHRRREPPQCESSFDNELSMLYGMTRMSLPQSSTGGTRITPDAGWSGSEYYVSFSRLSST